MIFIHTVGRAYLPSWWRRTTMNILWHKQFWFPVYTLCAKKVAHQFMTITLPVLNWQSCIYIILSLLERKVNLQQNPHKYFSPYLNSYVVALSCESQKFWVLAYLKKMQRKT